MKVLFVCSGNSPHIDAADGIVPFIRRQGESLRENGMEVDFFSIKGGGLKGYLKHVSILKKHLKENQYDVIHAHYGLCGWVAVLTFTRLPIVISFMGDDLYGDADEKGKRYLKDYFFIAAGRVLQYFVDYIIVKSPNLAQWISRFRRKKMEIIPNGVNFEVFKPMNREEALKHLDIGPLDKKVVLFLGDRDNPRKNFKLVSEALGKLGQDVELLTPFPVQGEMIPVYINVADVLVMTSFKEGSPNVIKEAMACNCPIVSTDVGDAKDVIGKTEGCYITAFDPNDLAEKMKHALDFNGRTTGRKDIEHLNQNQIASKLKRIYTELCPKG